MHPRESGAVGAGGDAPRTGPGFLTGFALLLPISLSTMAIVLLAPVLPLMMNEFRHVPAFEYWVPMVLTIPALCIALLSPFAGILGDRFGRRRLLLLSFILYAVVGVAPLFLHSLSAILLSRIGVGIAEALIMVLSTTMIGDYFKGEARDKWLAAQTAFATISALIFLNLGGQLGFFGWRTPFWTYGSALIMFLLVLKFTWEPRGEADLPVLGLTQGEGSGGFPWRGMLMILGITIYGSVFFYTVQIQASFGLNQLGLTDPAQIGFLTSLVTIGVLLGTFLYWRIAALPLRLLLLIEFGLLAAGFGIMGGARGPASFLTGCFLNQVGAGLLLPTLLVWSMSLLSFEVRARGAGLWQSAFALGQFLSPVVVTTLSKQAGGLLPAFLMMSAGAIIGAVISVIAPFRRGKQAVTAVAGHG